MENIGETQKRVYSEKAINVATFLGGPLATGIMMSENFKSMELFETARKALFIGIISMFAIIALLLLLPSPIVDKIPQQLIPFIYTGIAWLLFKKHQKEKIEELLEENAIKHSAWRIAGVGFGSMIVFLMVFLPFVLLTPAYEGEVLKFIETGDEIYYDKSINKNDIKEVGRALTTLQFFNTEYSVAIQVRDEGDNTYRVIFPVDKSFWNDEQLIYEMENLSYVFKEFVPDKDFKISLISETITGEERKDL